MTVKFEGNKAVMMPQGVYIIGTYDENGVPNAMNAAWGVQSGYGEITFFLGKHKTTDNLQKTGAFTVAFGTADTELISDYFGCETGRNVNKIEKAGVHVHKSEYVNAPVIEEFPLTMSCRVKSFDPATGILVGVAVGEEAQESILTDGKIDMGKMKALVFDPSFGAYRTIGETAGQAFHDGMSLKK